MKKMMFSLILLAAIGIKASAGIMESAVIFIETGKGEVLEMPTYQEEPLDELIPGDEIRLGTFYKTIDPAHLSRVLLCITKPETEEPVPFYLN